jgi:biopolymer transport protein ExbD
MQFARHKKEPVSLNLTPLIDVVFLLLIFFMVTTTFTKESRLTLELPEATGEPGSPVAAEMIEVTVSAGGEFAVNGSPLVNTKLETVKQAINEASQSDTSIPMVITADAQAPHQAVVRAMDAAGQLGFVHLSITTKQPQQ